MQFDYSLIDEQLVITDPKDFHYNCDEHPVDGDKLIIDMPTDEIKALRDYLDTKLERYQATRRRIIPKEPPANGFYTTGNGISILHNENGFWSVFDTSDGMAHVERARWAEACECLEADMLAEPLTRIMPIDFKGGAK